MWFISLRDLRFRLRRFVLAVAGTGLVFALSLLGSGLSEAFRAEAEQTVRGVGADRWIVPEEASGPFTGGVIFPSATADVLARTPGVTRAHPLLVLRQTVERDGATLDINVLGHRRGGLGRPPVARGREAAADGEAVVDSRLDLAIGERITVGAHGFTVVGLTRGLSYYAGVPNFYVSIRDAQRIAFRGDRFATAIVTQGVPARVPAGLRALTNDDARADLLRPLADGIGAIDLMRVLLWVVAATIIGVLVYLSSLERVRDFAVLRAMGSAARALYAGLVFQAVAISVAAAAVSVVLALALAPAFPLPVTVPAGAYALLPAIAVSVGLVSSLSGLRRATRVDPALAFGAP